MFLRSNSSTTNIMHPLHIKALAIMVNIMSIRNHIGMSLRNLPVLLKNERTIISHLPVRWILHSSSSLHHPIRSYHHTTSRTVDPVSSEGILLHELKGLALAQPLHSTKIVPISQELKKFYRQRDNFREVFNVKIIKLSATGNGIAVVKSEESKDGSIFVSVPFTLPGDVIDLKIGIHHDNYAEGHIMKMITPSKMRNDSLITCKYFNSCSGCQLQMLHYDEQIDFKTDIVASAFSQFGFDTAKLPLQNTVRSPLQYNYRTKSTPHFNSNRKLIKLGFEGVFNGRKRLFDLDSCDIATPVLNKALMDDRAYLINKVREYKRSGTILLRDTTFPSSSESSSYTIDHRQIIKQEVGGYLFEFPAGEFFQNNPSILPELISSISSHIDPAKHKLIVDTYCGSGFLGISLSDKIERLIGIEISKGNLDFASHNAKLNNVLNATFHLGSSEDIFSTLDSSDIVNHETIVILDPSRKGSNESYLNQLSYFEPDMIIYLSCNVFSQARDLDYFFSKTTNGGLYEMVSVQG